MSVFPIQNISDIVFEQSETLPDGKYIIFMNMMKQYHEHQNNEDEIKEYIETFDQELQSKIKTLCNNRIKKSKLTQLCIYLRSKIRDFILWFYVRDISCCDLCQRIIVIIVLFICIAFLPVFMITMIIFRPNYNLLYNNTQSTTFNSSSFGVP